MFRVSSKRCAFYVWRLAINVDQLHVHVKTQINIARGLTASDAPVFHRQIAQANQHVIARDAQWLQTGDDGVVEIALCLHRAAFEYVNAYQCVALGSLACGLL
jgi:lactam utilization protein B